MCINMAKGTSGFNKNDNVIKFPSGQINTAISTKWDYRGFKEAVDKIEQAVDSANTRVKVESAYRGISVQDKAITAELDRIQTGVDDTGDERILMAQRRRLRQLKKKLLDKGVM